MRNFHSHALAPAQLVIKLFFYKTSNCFVEIGYLVTDNWIPWWPVSSGCIPRKEGSGRSETQLRNHYVDGLREVTSRTVVYSVTKHLTQLSNLGWLPPGAVAPC